MNLYVAKASIRVNQARWPGKFGELGRNWGVGLKFSSFLLHFFQKKWINDLKKDMSNHSHFNAVQ